MVCLRGIKPLFLFAALFSLGLFSARLSAEDAIHVVAKGETLYSISRTYRVSQDEIMRHNNISDPSKLQAGKRLKIPQPVGTASSAAPQKETTSTANSAPAGNVAQGAVTEYRVVQKDTLYSIARTYNVTIQALRDINGFNKEHVLKIGELIKIPAAAKTVTGDCVLPVQGETAKVLLRWPVSSREITYIEGKLTGVFLLAERSEPVRSLTQGKVVAAGPHRGYGNVAIVETENYLYVYGSCESLSVKVGDWIGPGTELGKLGLNASTGKPQLVFMVYQNYAPIDPAKAPRA